MIPGFTDLGDDDGYRMTLPIRGDTNGSSVDLTIKDRVLTAEVKRETTGHMNSVPPRGPKSHFLLPRNVDLTQVRTSWTEDGQLRVEAPYLGWKDKQKSGQWAVQLPFETKLDPQKTTVMDNVMGIEKRLDEGSRDCQIFFNEVYTPMYKQRYTNPQKWYS